MMSTNTAELARCLVTSRLHGSGVLDLLEEAGVIDPRAVELIVDLIDLVIGDEPNSEETRRRWALRAAQTAGSEFI